MEAVFGNSSLNFQTRILQLSSGGIALMDPESTWVLEMLYRNPNIPFDYEKATQFLSREAKEYTFTDKCSFIMRIEKIRKYDKDIAALIFVVSDKYCYYESENEPYYCDEGYRGEIFEYNNKASVLAKKNKGDFSSIAVYLDEEERILLFEEILLEIINIKFPREYVQEVLRVLIKHNENLLLGECYSGELSRFYKSIFNGGCSLRKPLYIALTAWKNGNDSYKELFKSFWEQLIASLDELPAKAYALLIDYLRKIVNDDEFCRKQSLYCKDDIFLQVLQAKEGIKAVQRLAMIHILTESMEDFLNRLREKNTDNGIVSTIAHKLQSYLIILRDNNIEDNAFDRAIQDILNMLTSFNDIIPPSLVAIIDLFGEHKPFRSPSREIDSIDSPQPSSELNERDDGIDKVVERELGERKRQ